MKPVLYERTVYAKAGSLCTTIPRHIVAMLDIASGEKIRFEVSKTGLIKLYSSNEPRRRG